MMHMSGLSSIEYFTGLLLADCTIYMIPAAIMSFGLLAFPQIMDASWILTFFISYMLYGAALMNLVYISTYMFTEPDSNYKSISIIFTLGLIVMPISLSIWIAH